MADEKTPKPTGTGTSGGGEKASSERSTGDEYRDRVAEQAKAEIDRSVSTGANIFPGRDSRK